MLHTTSEDVLIGPLRNYYSSSTTHRFMQSFDVESIGRKLNERYAEQFFDLTQAQSRTSFNIPYFAHEGICDINGQLAKILRKHMERGKR